MAFPVEEGYLTMSEVGDSIQAKCLAFGDRVIKLNDYLLAEASKKEDVRCMSDVEWKKSDVKTGGKQHQPSYVKRQASRVPLHLKSVATHIENSVTSARENPT